MIGASLIIKRTATTTMTVGIISFIDPTSQLPFLPTFTYNYKFGNSWEFDFILPQRILFRKPIAAKGRLSLGTEFGGNGFYVNTSGVNNFPKVLEYSQLEVNTGAIYEHKFSNQIIATFKGGLTNFISNRLTEKGKANKDYLYNNTQEPSGYFNIGISFNPFGKK
ncbi:MAG: hypothetical protein P8H13_08475 [Polaribacter sp.]|nr:hypothetical protein [Polaribacter sp.]MDG1992987.1 hypothetical protein [Polaribacter sp.]